MITERDLEILELDWLQKSLALDMAERDCEIARAKYMTSRRQFLMLELAEPESGERAK
jgi:hypothetical protein